MAFKLGTSKGLQAQGGDIKSKFKFKSGQELIPGTNVFRKKLDDGVLAEANLDGSIYISEDMDINDPMLQHTLVHEMQHQTAMKIGVETYDDDAVYYKGEVWLREDGYVTNPHTGEKLIEGDKSLPWEANKI
tara:strand:- start:789 stop:1184 length:396 start_codon:yes stop_codon:yes gene_type:complete